MMQLRPLFFTALLAFMLVTPAASQSTDVVGEFSMHLQGGLTTDPAGYDAFRATTFGSAPAFGGGFTYVIYPNVAVRGDFHYAPKSGREECCPDLGNPGAVSEDVDLNRTYYGASLLIRLPMARAVPYLKLGGGFIDIMRDALSYQYEFAEFGAQLGGGVSLPLGDSPVSFFVDAVEWIYTRVGTGEGTQYDTLVSAGLSYALIR